VLGQVGLPVFRGLFTFTCLAITSSTEATFSRVISDPIELAGFTDGLATKVLAIFGIRLAIIRTNIIGLANTLVTLALQILTFAKGALVTAMLAISF
jgi:cytosine/uracil/thiamine/allantoin permease